MIERFRKMKSEEIVYFENLNGHRESYNELFVSCFSLSPLTGKMNVKKFFSLVSAKKLLFGTLDDGYFSFMLISVLRTVLGKKTVAIFIRPAQCFMSNKIIYRIKFFLFYFLKRLKKISVVTIVPFSIRESYKKVAAIGLHDPQLWDLSEEKHWGLESELSARIISQAKGRKIVSFVGSVSENKGIEFFIRLIAGNSYLKKDFLFVIAGKFNTSTVDYKEKIKDFDVVVYDKFINNLELSSLYNVSDYVWCCYHPDYDQASGVFGRAVQSGTIAITREGALLNDYNIYPGVRTLTLNYGEIKKSGSDLLHSLNSIEPSENKSLGLFHEWKKSFISSVELRL